MTMYVNVNISFWNQIFFEGTLSPCLALISPTCRLVLGTQHTSWKIWNEALIS